MWRVYQRGLERWIIDLLQPLLDSLVKDGLVPRFVQVGSLCEKVRGPITGWTCEEWEGKPLFSIDMDIHGVPMTPSWHIFPRSAYCYQLNKPWHLHDLVRHAILLHCVLPVQPDIVLPVPSEVTYRGDDETPSFSNVYCPFNPTLYGLSPQRLRIVEMTLDHEAPSFSNMRRRNSRKDSDLTGVVDLRCGLGVGSQV